MNEDDEDLYDLAFSEEIIEQKLADLPEPSSSSSDHVDKKGELELYAKHFRKLIIGARKKICDLQKEKEELGVNLKHALESGGIVICPNCTHHFKDRHNLLKPRHMKTYRANKCVEVEFETVDDLNTWLYLNQLETNSDRFPTLMKNGKTVEKKEQTLNTVGSKLHGIVEKQKNERKRKIEEDNNDEHVERRRSHNNDERIKEKIRIGIRKESVKKKVDDDRRKRYSLSPRREERRIRDEKRREEDRKREERRRETSSSDIHQQTTSSRRNTPRIDDIREERKHRDDRNRDNKAEKVENKRKEDIEPPKKKISMAERLSFVGRTNHVPEVEKDIKRDIKRVEINHSSRRNIIVANTEYSVGENSNVTKPNSESLNIKIDDNPKKEHQKKTPTSVQGRKSVVEGYKIPKILNKWCVKKPVEVNPVEPYKDKKSKQIVPETDSVKNESIEGWKIPVTPVWNKNKKSEITLISPPLIEPILIEDEDRITEEWKAPDTPVWNKGQSTGSGHGEDSIDYFENVNCMSILEDNIFDKSNTETQYVDNSYSFDEKVEPIMQCEPIYEHEMSESDKYARIMETSGFNQPIYNSKNRENAYELSARNLNMELVKLARDKNTCPEPVKPARRRITFEDDMPHTVPMKTSTPKYTPNDDPITSERTTETIQISNDDFDPFSEFFPDVDKNNLFGSSFDFSKENDCENMNDVEKNDESNDEMSYWMSGDGEVENEGESGDNSEECESVDMNETSSSDNENSSKEIEEEDVQSDKYEDDENSVESDEIETTTFGENNEEDLNAEQSEFSIGNSYAERSVVEKEADISREELDWDFDDEELFGNVSVDEDNEDDKTIEGGELDVSTNVSPQTAENTSQNDDVDDLEEGELSSDDEEEETVIHVETKTRTNMDENERKTCIHEPVGRNFREKPRDVWKRITSPVRRNEAKSRGNRSGDRSVNSYAYGVHKGISDHRQNRRSSEENYRENRERQKSRSMTTNENRLLKRRN